MEARDDTETDLDMGNDEEDGLTCFAECYRTVCEDENTEYDSTSEDGEYPEDEDWYDDHTSFRQENPSGSVEEQEESFLTNLRNGVILRRETDSVQEMFADADREGWTSTNDHEAARGVWGNPNHHK